MTRESPKKIDDATPPDDPDDRDAAGRARRRRLERRRRRPRADQQGRREEGPQGRRPRPRQSSRATTPASRAQGALNKSSWTSSRARAPDDDRRRLRMVRRDAAGSVPPHVTRLIGLLTAVLAALALAACGAGSDETTTADFRKDYAPISAAIRGLGTEVGGAVTSAKDEVRPRAAGAVRGPRRPRERRRRRPREGAGAGRRGDHDGARRSSSPASRRAAADLDAISARGGRTRRRGGEGRDDPARASDSAAIREPRRKLDQLVLSSN